MKLLLTSALLVLFSLQQAFSQCIVTDDEAKETINKVNGTDKMVGNWKVNIRGTLFYKNQILQSDYEEYPMYWYILPKANGYVVCATPGFEEDIIDGMLIKDEAIDNQFFFYGSNGVSKEVSLGRMISDSILTFNFEASPNYLNENFGSSIKPEAMEDVSLLFEYILTKTD